MVVHEEKEPRIREQVLRVVVVEVNEGMWGGAGIVVVFAEGRVEREEER